MLPLSVIHDPISEATYGLVGENVTLPAISYLALTTFGFLWNHGNYFSCSDAVSTTWAQESSVTTSWSLFAGVTTTWTEIS